MKIVLDTNIVVSGLLSSQGNPAQVLTLALAGAVQACYDERILAEYAEVLARPRFKFDPKRVREVLNKIETDGLAIDASEESNLNLPDADDEPFLAVALAASADFLVTGNWRIIRPTSAGVARLFRPPRSWSIGGNCRAKIEMRQG